MMLRYLKLCSIFFMLLPSGHLYAGGSDREINPEDTCHKLNTSIRFSSQPINIEIKGVFHVTAPYQLTGSSQQKVIEYDGNPAARDRGEQSLLPSSPHTDGRKQVQNTSIWPYCAHGHLDLFFGETRCGGSGVLVGPFHVLTCAHNVYDPEKKVWVDRVKFYPGLNDTAALSGCVA